MYMCVQHGVCVVYVHIFSLIPVLVQFSLENSQITFLLTSEVRVKSFSILAAQIQGLLMICLGRP